MTLAPDEVTRVRSLHDRLDIKEVEDIYLPLSRLLSLYVAATQRPPVPSATPRRANEAALAVVVTLLAGAATFLLGFNDGSYQLTDRSAIGIAAWWALAVGMAFKLWPGARVPRAA